jgi:hypothetical protein
MTSIMSRTQQVQINDQNIKKHEIMSRRDYTTEEAEATWMTESDFSHIKRSIREIVILMNQGSAQANSQSEIYCTRGLECLTTQGNSQKKKTTLIVRQAVLKEQHRQCIWRQFIYSPERLAELASDLTNHSRVAAHVVGIMDAKCVASANGTSANYSVKPTKVEMARLEIMLIRESGEMQKKSRLSFVSQAA